MSDQKEKRQKPVMPIQIRNSRESSSVRHQSSLLSYSRSSFKAPTRQHLAYRRHLSGSLNASSSRCCAVCCRVCCCRCVRRRRCVCRRRCICRRRLIRCCCCVQSLGYRSGAVVGDVVRSRSPLWWIPIDTRGDRRNRCICRAAGSIVISDCDGLGRPSSVFLSRTGWYRERPARVSLEIVTPVSIESWNARRLRISSWMPPRLILISANGENDINLAVGILSEPGALKKHIDSRNA